MSSRFRVSFPADGRHLKPLRDWCRIYLERALPSPRLDDLILAVTEACANTIEHCCNGNQEREVEIEFEVERDGVRARIQSFCLAALLHQIRSRPLDEVRPRGLGMRFIENSVDKVEYVDQKDGYLSLVLTKKRKGRSRGG